jgi:hypothetical protein
VNVSTSEASLPKVTEPELENVTAFVIVPPALIAILYAPPVPSVVAVKAPLNVIVPVVAVNVTVAALTVLENVVPPDLVTVTVPISVPTAPLTVTAPVVLIVKLEVGLPAVPVTEDKLNIFPIPVPTVRVTSFAKVAAPNVIFPVDVPPTVEFPETVTPLPPKLITPVSA